MSNLQAFLSKIKIDQKTENTHFVYYDQNTGNIKKISTTNKTLDGYNILEVSTDEVKFLLSGEKKTSDFKVVFDIVKKKTLLKEVKNKSTDDIELTFYKIPMVSKKDMTADFNIKQMKTNWQISLSEEVKTYLTSSAVDISNYIHLSITTLDDPHVLIESVKLKLEDLIKNKNIKIPHKTKITEPVSVYTTKYFESYAHGV
jgi:hypothetical protein